MDGAVDQGKRSQAARGAIDITSLSLHKPPAAGSTAKTALNHGSG